MDTSSQRAGGKQPGRKAVIVQEGRMSLSELLFDRAGAPSPFGDDLQFPLPVESLTYVHPVEGAPPTE